MPEHLRVQYRAEQDWTVSSDRVRSELGYIEPVPGTVALERTIAWERENPSQIFRQVFDYEAEDRALTAVCSR